VTPVLAQLDVQNPHLEDMAWCGTFNKDRAGQDVRPRTALAARMDLLQLGRNVKLRRIRHEVGRPRHAINRDFIAALHGEHRLELRIEKSPMAGLRAGFEMVVGHRGLLTWNMTGQALA